MTLWEVIRGRADHALDGWDLPPEHRVALLGSSVLTLIFGPELVEAKADAEARKIVAESLLDVATAAVLVVDWREGRPLPPVEMSAAAGMSTPWKPDSETREDLAATSERVLGNVTTPVSAILQVLVAATAGLEVSVLPYGNLLLGAEQALSWIGWEPASS